MRSTLVAALGGIALTIASCSISDSIKSSSESSASSSGSSSSSSASQRESYTSDVRDYTAAYAKSGGQFEGFTRGLSSIASKHGVSNWEDDLDTYTGIGAGLKKANIPAAQFEVWKQNLAGSDASKAAAMQKGYNDQQPQ